MPDVHLHGYLGGDSVVMHESVDANGINHFTETEVPKNVIVVDEAGKHYSLVGAIWFGGRADEILTTAHMFNIVGSGGVSDSIKLVERFRFGQLIQPRLRELRTSFALSRCRMPTALDNGRRSPKKFLRAVVARLLGRKPR
jgi:hypothetical protein